VRAAHFIVAAIAASGAWACAPEIGDSCTGALDCAVDGTRVCDSTQEGGYCLVPACRPDECPEEAVCVQFGELERARTFCMRHCGSEGDCRGGYSCVSPGDLSLATAIVDEDPRGSKFCMEDLPTE
jgi:hypothetical protein